MNDAVLVVGAGPVGLAGALGLVRSGVRVRIIDRLMSPTNQSRAAIVHARTMEHFERLGCVEEFVAEGVQVHGAVVYGSGGIRLTRASLEHLPTAYPYMLGLEQFATERLLTARLRAAGVEIERGVELVGLTDHGDRVTAKLRAGAGEVTEHEFAYVLGADGAHSTVRATLGLHLEGETIDTTWITADVKIRWTRDPGEAVSFLTPEGIAFIAAMNDDRWRVIVSSHKMTPEAAAAISLADVQALVTERCGEGVELYDPVWISPFGINTRMAPTMRRGRIFLAGDASHVHSPIGGQGMNTGIQDALNLAWKLGLVLAGTARPELLDSYDPERHTNARNLLRAVGPLTRMANLSNILAIEVRNHVIQLVTCLGLNKNGPRMVSMLSVGYPDSPIVSEGHISWNSRGPRSGERAPEADGLLTASSEAPSRLHALWSGDQRHQLVQFLGDGDASTIAPLPASPLYRVMRIARQGTPAADLVIDTLGDAHDAYEAPAGAFYLVRPDGIIAYRDPKGDPEGLAAYLRAWYPGA